MADEEVQQPVPEVVITFEPEELAQALQERRQALEQETEEESG